MTRSFFVLIFLLGSYKTGYAQEDSYVEVKSFDIVPGVGPQTKTVRFNFERMENKEETQFILNRVSVRYAVAASMEIEIDLRFSKNGKLLNFLKRVKGHNCGKETLDYDNGILIGRTFEPYETDCIGAAEQASVSKNRDNLDTHDIQRGSSGLEEAHKYWNLFAELTKTLLNE